MREKSKNKKLIIITAITIIIVIIGIIIGKNTLNINILSNKYNTANSSLNNANLLPEYIKAGITIVGITGTLEDLDTSDATATEMDISYGKTAYVDGKKITGLFVSRDSLEIGDYVNYIPEESEEYDLPSTVTGYTNNQSIAQEDLKWQILSINDDGTIDIISEKPTNESVYFMGSLGYNNGVYIINDICKKQYSNNALGITARSITMEDIEHQLNENGINARSSFIYEGVQYGNKRTYTSSNDLYYPIIFAQENGGGINTDILKTDGIDRSESYYTSPTNDTYAHASQSLTMMQQWYLMEKKDTPNFFDNKSFYNLIFGESQNFSYWVASRYMICGDINGGFGIRSIDEGDISDGQLYISYNVDEQEYKSIRPLISINQEIQIYGGDGTKEHPYQLKK